MGGDDEVDEKSSKQITAAVFQLARAVTATEGVGEVKLTSANLNLTTEARPLAELTARTVKCDTASAAPTEVAMPSDVLSSVPGLDPLLPVSVVLFSSAVNLHKAFDAGSAAGGAASGGGSTSTNAASSGRSEVRSSPMVSFSLLQSGSELRISGAASRINVSIPFDLARSSGKRRLLEVRRLEGRRLDGGGDDGDGDSSPPCIGKPVNGTYTGCLSAIECRWWDESGNGSWSSAGCETVPTDDGGSFTCSCDHLTDFIVFEFPTTVEELLEDVLEAFAVNRLTAAAFECLARPSFADTPVVWLIVMLLIVTFFVGLGNAVRRDRREMHNVEALLKGKRADAKNRAVDLIKAVAKKERKRREAEEAAAGKIKGGGWGAALAGAGEAGLARHSMRNRVVSVFAPPGPRRGSCAVAATQLKHASSAPAVSIAPSDLSSTCRETGKPPQDGADMATSRRCSSMAMLRLVSSIGRHASPGERCGSPPPSPPGKMQGIPPETSPPLAPPTELSNALAGIMGSGTPSVAAVDAHLPPYTTTPVEAAQVGSEPDTPRASGDAGVGAADDVAMVEETFSAPPTPRPCIAEGGPTVVFGRLPIFARGGGSPSVSLAPKKSADSIGTGLCGGGLGLCGGGMQASSHTQTRIARQPSSECAEASKVPSRLKCLVSDAAIPAAAAKLAGACEAAVAGAAPEAVAAPSSLAVLLKKQQKASRIEADVLGIFGNRRSLTDAGGDDDGAEEGAPKPSAAVRWKQAKLVVQQEVFVKRWHKDVDRNYKRLWLSFKDSHTLMAGVLYRGAAGFTRAQTVMVSASARTLSLCPSAAYRWLSSRTQTSSPAV